MKTALIILGLLCLALPVLAEETDRVNCPTSNRLPCICTTQGKICAEKEGDPIRNPVLVDHCQVLDGELIYGSTCKITTDGNRILWVVDIGRNKNGVKPQN